MTRVLLVDDDRAVRRSLAAMLEADGYEVVTATDVSEALDVLKIGPFDILISDLVMPGRSGLDLLCEAHAMTPTMQAILMSGMPTLESAAEAVRHGAADYLIKPVSAAALRRSVGHAAQVKRLSDERARLEVANREYQANLETLVEERTSKLNVAINDLRNAMEEGVYAMARLVERRDLYTSGHQRRVAALSDAVAKAMGLDDSRRAGVRFAALVHDVGKVTIPAEILGKPGPLSRIEFALVRTHSEAGYAVFRDVHLSWPIADVIYQHHERMDGSGYPRGVSGEAILIEARILAVADVVEAMSSHRPYRPALGIAKATEEIVGGAGVVYDSAVVNACAGVLSGKEFRFDP